MSEDRHAERLVSLAAGTVLDIGPAETVAAAAAAGYAAVGIWFDPDTWTDETTRAVRQRLDDTGLVALDIEPVILGRGGDGGRRLVETAAALGARHVLMASGKADHAEVSDRFAELCDLALPAGIVVVLEFLPIFTVGTAQDALRIVSRAERSNGGVLIDSLHLARSGATPADLTDLAGFDPKLLPYLQLADATATASDSSPGGLRQEALHGRLLPGDGALPLVELLDAVPDVPISLELRSAELMAVHPDPVERASAVLQATNRLLATAADRAGRDPSPLPTSVRPDHS
jgi:sugar phosphate isomerase/epimerase